MRVIEIWRHAVKSMQGERLEVGEIDANGLRHDRAWGIRNLATGHVLTGRREPRLLLASSRLGAGDQPVITLPDGQELEGTGDKVDAALSAWLGIDVSLAVAADSPRAEAEFFADATDDTSRAIKWQLPQGKFVDLEPLLLLTTASLRAGQALHPEGVWDVRRFRPNLLIEADGEGWVEDGWAFGPLRIGGAELVGRAPCERCTMVTRQQPGLDHDTEVFKTLNRNHGATFGLWTSVASPGVVRIGDAVMVG